MDVWPRPPRALCYTTASHSWCHSPAPPPRSNIIDRRWGRGWRPAFVYQHTVTNDGSLRSYAVASLVVWREANRKQTHRAVSVSAGVCVCACVWRRGLIQRWPNNVTPIRAHLNVKGGGWRCGTGGRKRTTTTQPNISTTHYGHTCF